MLDFDGACKLLKQNPKKWLITGSAGFIGSNLVEVLLSLNQKVVGLDNFSTGSIQNNESIKESVSDALFKNFQFIEGDCRDYQTCFDAANDVDYVLHQAALGSVPRSILNPIDTNAANVTGFLNMLYASKERNVKNFVYAASSSSYGDHKDLPKVENNIGNPLSPYAVSKLVNELYADVFGKCYGFQTIGLRYFNVFGKRQDPKGAYAAVIPKWISKMLDNEEISIYGDGESSRDFCYIDNVIQINILAALSKQQNISEVFNVAYGERNSLNKLFEIIRTELTLNGHQYNIEPTYKEFRKGDVRHSLADISKAKKLLGYYPKHSLQSGLKHAIKWYLR